MMVSWGHAAWHRDGGALAVGALALGLFIRAPLPIAIAGAALYVAVVLADPWTCVPLTIVTLPFYLHPRAVAGIDVSATELAILLGAVAVLGTGVLHREALGRTVHWPRPGFIDAAAAGFIAAALLSLIVTEYPKESLRELRWLVLEPILFSYLVRATVDSPARTLASLWAIVLSGAVAAAISIGALVASGDLLLPVVRAMAPYTSANQLGMYLGRAAAVALAVALFSRSGGVEEPQKLSKGSHAWVVAAWLLLALIGLGIVRTISLGAIIGTGAAAAVLVALRNRRALWLFVPATAAIVLLALVGLPTERTLGRFDAGTGTALFRLEIWQSAIKMGLDHPILGVGLDNFLYLYRSLYIEPAALPEPNISHPHNWILNFWLELGLVGLVSALAMIAWIARAAHRSFWEGGSAQMRVLGAAAAGVFIDMLVHGFVDNSYFLVDAATVWWLVAALLAVRQDTLLRRESLRVPRSATLLVSKVGPPVP